MKDPGNRAKAAIVAVLVWLAADLGVTGSAVQTIAALGGFGAPSAQPDYAMVDRIAMISGGALVLATLAAIILVSRWILNVNRNAQLWSDGVSVTPGWNVGYFFVPIANLWKPFEGLRQTWQASHNPADPEAVSVPGFMRVWWGAWILSNILGNASFRLSLKADTAEKLINVSWLDVVSLAVDVPLTIALIMLIRRLTAVQQSAMSGGRIEDVFA